MSARRVVFAGGGTAGHVQPALAVAKKWRESHPADSIIFLGTSSGLENTLVPQAGFELAHITRVRVPRSLTPSLLKVPAQLRTAITESKQILKDADLLIGFGGYVCAPAYLAAHSLKIPIVIHEANAKPGWANRLGARYTSALAVGTPVSSGPFAGALITGLPLREDIAQLLIANEDSDSSEWSALRRDARLKFELDANQKTILIFGGSQGSAAINSVIAAARVGLTERGFAIIHSAGGFNALPASDNSYKAFAYIDEMAAAYLAADLIIARSGAITCSEVAALGKFALFIPLPVGNGEQAVNAHELVSAGRAMTVEQDAFTSAWLLDNIDSMLAKSALQGDGVERRDLAAAAKIVALMEHQLENSMN